MRTANGMSSSVRLSIAVSAWPPNPPFQPTASREIVDFLIVSVVRLRRLNGNPFGRTSSGSPHQAHPADAGVASSLHTPVQYPFAAQLGLLFEDVATPLRTLNVHRQPSASSKSIVRKTLHLHIYLYLFEYPTSVEMKLTTYATSFVSPLDSFRVS
jgi:hypothetical protein